MNTLQTIVACLAGFIAGAYVLQTAIATYGVPSLPKFERTRAAARSFASSKVSFPLPLLVAAILGALVFVDPTKYIPDIPIPGPTPTPTPIPVVTDKLAVLIVEETGERSSLPAAQLAAMNSAIWRDYVAGKGGQFAVLDDDSLDTDEERSKAPQWVKDAFAIERQSVPWLYASNGTTGISQPLPANLDDLLAALKKVGG